jgi:hypothetical protein
MKKCPAELAQKINERILCLYAFSMFLDESDENDRHPGLLRHVGSDK